MIERGNAIEFLLNMVNSGIMSDNINSALQDIANCIVGEEDGLHLWGAPDEDVATMYTEASEEALTKEFKEKADKLYAEYRFFPSKFEEEQEIQNESGDSTDESDSDE